MLRVPAKREGLSVISTVTNKGEMRWRIYSGALNAKIADRLPGAADAQAAQKDISDSG